MILVDLFFALRQIGRDDECVFSFDFRISISLLNLTHISLKALIFFSISAFSFFNNSSSSSVSTKSMRLFSDKLISPHFWGDFCFVVITRFGKLLANILKQSSSKSFTKRRITALMIRSVFEPALAKLKKTETPIAKTAVTIRKVPPVKQRSVSETDLIRGATHKIFIPPYTSGVKCKTIRIANTIQPCALCWNSFSHTALSRLHSHEYSQALSW
mmetsp:Transcript_11055/g.16248  ORF Transcript_11055/g.16248 Transcript_11055/m.16248 type:complete len:215 (+) Transcript_11055:133-777(+)